METLPGRPAAPVVLPETKSGCFRRSLQSPPPKAYGKTGVGVRLRNRGRLGRGGGEIVRALHQALAPDPEKTGSQNYM